MSSPSVKETAKKWYRLLPFPSEYDQDFETILNNTNIKNPLPFQEYDWSTHEADQNVNLVMVLYFLEDLHNRYEKAGISDDIFYETAKEITVYTRRCKEATGAIGIQRLPMSLRILSMHLFRIGRLQFCMEPLACDVPEKGLKAGDPVMDLHITEDGSLDMASCKESFTLSESFFLKHFPDFKFQYYTCNSWLMDENLKHFLPANANILKFQRLFEIYNKREYDSVLHFMFRYGIESREELRNYPATTSFAQKIKDYALSGGALYIALGIRDKNNLYFPC